MERAVVRGLRLLLATLLCATGLVFGLSQQARAVEPVPLVSIYLDSVNPALPKRDGTITIRGRVTNITDQPLFRLQAIFWRNQAPITTGDQLNQAVASPSNEPFGSRLTSTYQDLYQTGEPELGPGKSASFTLTASVDDLALSPTSGVYLMGVHVLQNGNTTAVGRARVFIPVLDAVPQNTLQLTSLVLLNSRPSQVRSGVFSDGQLAKEVAPGGRLSEMLDAAGQPDVSFVVDPALIDELKTMKDGYQVLTRNGSTGPGTGSADASEWLQRFAALTRRQDGYRLPYGTPDIAALAHQDMTAVLARGSEAAEAVPETADLPLLAMPAAGAADDDTLKAAESLNPVAIVLSDASAAGDGPLLQGIGSAPIVRYTATAFGGGPRPDPSDTPVHLRQRMLADTWIQATTSAPGSTLGRVRVITNAAQAEGDDGSQEVPWMKRSPLSTLLRSTPAPWSKKLRYTSAMSRAELSAAWLFDTADLARSYDTYAELLAEPTQAETAADRALARSVSAVWRGRDANADRFIRSQQRDLSATLRDGVKLTTTPRVTTSGARGFFPITVLNRLAASDDPDANAVRVQVRFTSDNSQRVTIATLDSELIRAQRNFTGNAQVNASSNGTVRVRAQLTTPSGTPIGRPLDIDVRVTQAGTVGWFIAVGAGVVLIGATALRIRQVAKERSGSATAAEDRDLDAEPVGPPPVTPPAVSGASGAGTTSAGTSSAGTSSAGSHD